MLEMETVQLFSGTGRNGVGLWLGASRGRSLLYLWLSLVLWLHLIFLPWRINRLSEIHSQGAFWSDPEGRCAWVGAL